MTVHTPWHQAVEVFLERDVPDRHLAPSTVTSYHWAGDIIVDHLGTIRFGEPHRRSRRNDARRARRP